MNALRSVDRSMLDKPIRPYGMSSRVITPEQRTVLESVVLDIFADMTNAGATLQATLSAIYMSGVQHTLETTRKHE